MSNRELVVLGTASQVPTRDRNHNSCVLRWDDEVILFDPGEGTQRQMALARISPTKVTRVCVTHFHGDHCLGLPGVLQRLAIERPGTTIDLHYPAEGEPYLDHLRHATVVDEVAPVRAHPATDGTSTEAQGFTLLARGLDHRGIPTVGWRLEEPARRHLLPDRLEAEGISGPDAGQLKHEGKVEVGGHRVELGEVSDVRPGQVFAFVMDTRLCDAAFELAADADLLVCEATFLDAEEDLAHRYGHLTAAQAARIAAEAGARRLVLTHFSSRHPDEEVFLAEAREIFDDVVVGHDLRHVEVPHRAD